MADRAKSGGGVSKHLFLALFWRYIVAIFPLQCRLYFGPGWIKFHGLGKQLKVLPEDVHGLLQLPDSLVLNLAGLLQLDDIGLDRAEFGLGEFLIQVL